MSLLCLVKTVVNTEDIGVGEGKEMGEKLGSTDDSTRGTNIKTVKSLQHIYFSVLYVGNLNRKKWLVLKDF